MSSDSDLAKILTALQGVTVLEKPRVSREVQKIFDQNHQASSNITLIVGQTIISVLREHTNYIQDFKNEISSMTGIVKALATEAADSKRIVQMLQADVKKTQRDCEDINKNMQHMKQDMQEMGEQIQSLLALKKIVKEQADQIEDLNKQFGDHKEEMGAFILTNTHNMSNLDSKMDRTQTQLAELKDYVDHFGENLVLAATQITVETSAGFSERPTSLLEVLKQCNAALSGNEATLLEHTDQIKANSADILTKADEAVLFDVENLQGKVKAIEAHMKREEEQGVSAIRKQCESLAEEVQLIQHQVADKVDHVVVEGIVHRKYEDIVQYLQDALQSTAEDENNFKIKANELQETMSRLSAAKADRTDIAPMQEVLVRTEAMLHKISASQKEAQQKTHEIYTKEEINALMLLKVDKTEMDHQLEELAKNQKKRGKSSATFGGPSLVEDDIHKQVAGQPPGDSNMWKGIADVMKNESDTLIAQSGGSLQPPPLLQSSNPQHHQQQQQQAQVGGSRGNAMVTAGAGAAGLLQSQSAGILPAIGQIYTGPIGQIVTPQPRLGSAPSSAISPANVPKSEFGQFIKNKKAQATVTKSASSAAFPGNNVPGNFRASSEGGQTGIGSEPRARSKSPPGALGGGGFPGLDRPMTVGSVSSSSLHEAYSNNVYAQPEYHTQGEGVGGRTGHDMSFLGGPMSVAGGGFNMRSGHFRNQGLRSLGDTNEEATANMVRGKDGRYYHTDTEGDFDARTPSANMPNVVPVGKSSRKAHGGGGHGISDEIE